MDPSVLRLSLGVTSALDGGRVRSDMLAAVALTAFIIALTLILVGGLIELRTEVRVARRDRVGVVEWVWIVLPVVFLFAVCVFAAEHGLRR